MKSTRITSHLTQLLLVSFLAALMLFLTSRPNELKSARDMPLRQSDGASYAPSISGDGRYVVFHSFANNLVPDDTNGTWDVFVYDRDTGIIERVSIAGSGEQGNDESVAAGISRDGRYVSFQSLASNLVEDDTNGTWDVFVYDRETATLRRINATSAEAYSTSITLNADGRYAVFVSSTSADAQQVYLYDTLTGESTLVSHNADGEHGDANSFFPAISGDGQFVAFTSLSNNLVPDSPTDALSIFLYSRATDSVRRIASTVISDSVVSYSPAFSGDGRYIAFVSTSTTHHLLDLVLYDRETGDTTMLSPLKESYSEVYNDPPAVNFSGDVVAFVSALTSFVPGDTNGTWDVFVYDRERDTTARVSINSGGVQSNGSSSGVDISDDGRYVVFQSNATNLTPDDTNGFSDIFLHDRETGETVRVSVPSE